MAAVLGSNGAYSPSLVAAAFFAAQHASSRHEFERLLGLHASGYPSLLRSDVAFHSYRHAAKRGVTWPQSRRQLRRLFAAVKAARSGPPAPLRP